MHYWHNDISIADVGNIQCGAALGDSYAAAKTVIGELLQMAKTVIIIGGSHDNTMAQYYAYKDLNKIIEATVIDSNIDLKSKSQVRNQNFLMEMIKHEPKLIKHYNNLGF